MASDADFMKQFKKGLDTKPHINQILTEPDYFLHSGNYALNKLMTRNFLGAIPQGRLTMFAGGSSTGKSLIAASCIATIIKDGGFGFVVDSETSLDEGFMRNCGVDVDSDHYQYLGVDGIPEATGIVNDILKRYRTTGITTRGLIVVDSLNMLLTKTEQDNLEKDGTIKGDQGQQAKQIKGTLKTWVHSITGLPVSIICTQQPYVEQDQQKAYENPWVITESWRFAFSQIILFEKLAFKVDEGGKKVHKGFTLKGKSFKNRFAPEKQVVKIEIPFEKGVDEFSGLIEIALEYGIISKKGGWYTPVLYDGNPFQQKKAEADLVFMHMLLDEIRKVDDPSKEVNAVLDEYINELDNPSPKVSRKKKVKVKDKTEGTNGGKTD